MSAQEPELPANDVMGMLIDSEPPVSPMVVARAKLAGPVCDSSQATVGHGSPLSVGSLEVERQGARTYTGQAAWRNALISFMPENVILTAC